MVPKIGDKMKVSPQLTDQADWIDGDVIDVKVENWSDFTQIVKVDD